MPNRLRLFAVSPSADPYLRVLLVMLAGAVSWTAATGAAGFAIGNPVIVDAALALGLWCGILLGVAVAQAARAAATQSVPTARQETRSGAEEPEAATLPKVAPARAPHLLREIQVAIVVGGIVGVVGVVQAQWAADPTPPLLMVTIAGLCIVGAWLAGTAARYLSTVDPALLPEASGLARGARIVAWALTSGAVAVALCWAGLPEGVRLLHVLWLVLGSAVCIDLAVALPAEPLRFPADLHTFSVLGNRWNPFGSALDVAQRQLGIDLRSTWALTVIRRSAEPLVVGLCLVGWLSTALTVVGLDEQGLVERLGVPVGGPPLAPGLHLQWPWPVGRVALIPVRKVQTLHVGHEEEEERGPEDVLWARQHAKSEYTLLLGNGRDLIAIDAALQFRVADPFAWHYHNRNPADALRAIAYRAVMKATVDRTLADTLSENVAVLTTEMRDAVQAEADALGLGVEVVAFTIGGMHPPVGVAADYQAVVSAALRKTTVAVEARSYANKIVPKARAKAIIDENAARASGAETLGKAAGEAWSFRAVESEYHAAPDEYRFRRRLEALEKVLGGRPFAVIDERIQRDGGEIWLTR